MMLCVSPNCVVRSSLEEMLEALQRRDEREMLRDVPPALPRRAVARSRPPSAKRRLPVAVSSGCVVKGEMRGQNEMVAVQKGFHGYHGRQHLPELNAVVIAFQSYVRGEIARKRYSVLLGLKKVDNRGSLDHNPKMLPLVVEELQKRVSMLEATLELREEETASLRVQVEQYKARWSEFEAKTKSNEESWQKQIASLQMDLAAAQKGVVAEQEKAVGSNGVKEFKVTFKNESQAIIELENSNHASASPGQKFRGLKRLIKAWTRDHKVRVRDSSTKIHSTCHSEVAHTHWWTWWGKKSKRH